MIDKNKIKEGDFFKLKSGYSGKATNKAMQVMELWPKSMTVKTKGGCLTKPYSEFEKVNDVSKFKEVHYATWFENNLN
ncbi:hypothetical protein [uncultured Draconibacterium sp.]|uniref:hypothetical protein n=1 Tax=uncultured Draconibacterium sp. TaxID=1573823 RepID=UPI0025F7E198|nr:hypothetical protein [uncultured Draconibacterium sp.]